MVIPNINKIIQFKSTHEIYEPEKITWFSKNGENTPKEASDFYENYAIKFWTIPGCVGFNLPFTKTLDFESFFFKKANNGNEFLFQIARGNEL